MLEGICLCHRYETVRPPDPLSEWGGPAVWTGQMKLAHPLFYPVTQIGELFFQPPDRLRGRVWPLHER